MESKDVLASIFVFIPLNDYSDLFCVSKSWNEMSNDDYLWNLVFKTRLENETTKKALQIEKLLGRNTNIKLFCKNCMLKELVPKWKKEFSLLLDQTAIPLQKLLSLTQKLSESRYLYKEIIERGNIYEVIFQNYTPENKLVFQKLFKELYEVNKLKFKYFKDIYIKIFKLKNKEITSFIQPYLVKEFKNKVKNPVAIFQHAISYDTVSIEIVQAIIENRKKELTQNQNLLTNAIKFASPTIVKYLVISGFDPNQQMVHPILSLLSTCIPDESCFEKLKFLMTYTLNINIKDRNGDTPLTLVCQMKPLNTYVYKMVQLLINYGANLSEKNKNDETGYQILKKQVYENESNLKIGLEIESLFNKFSLKK